MLFAFAYSSVHAAPGDILFSDNFEDGNLSPWSRSSSSNAGVSIASGFAATGSWGANTRHGVVTVTSRTFNAAAPATRLDIWIRRGADSFSEDTDSGEDLVLEYRRANNSASTGFAGVSNATWSSNGSGGQGYDTNVTGIRVTPGGTFNAASNDNVLQFTLQMRVRID